MDCCDPCCDPCCPPKKICQQRRPLTTKQALNMLCKDRGMIFKMPSNPKADEIYLFKGEKSKGNYEGWKYDGLQWETGGQYQLPNCCNVRKLYFNIKCSNPCGEIVTDKSFRKHVFLMESSDGCSCMAVVHYVRCIDSQCRADKTKRCPTDTCCPDPDCPSPNCDPCCDPCCPPPCDPCPPKCPPKRKRSNKCMPKADPCCPPKCDFFCPPKCPPKCDPCCDPCCPPRKSSSSTKNSCSPKRTRSKKCCSPPCCPPCCPPKCPPCCPCPPPCPSVCCSRCVPKKTCSSKRCSNQCGCKSSNMKFTVCTGLKILAVVLLIWLYYTNALA